MLRTELRLAALGISRERRRTLLALAAIVVGIAGYLLASGFIEWIFWAIRESAIQSGLGHIQITARPHPSGGKTSDESRLPSDQRLKRAIESTQGVLTVAPRLKVSGMVSRGESTVPFIGEGIEPSRERAITAELKMVGERLKDDDPEGVLLGRGLAKALGAAVGDTVVLIAGSENGALSGRDGVVRGLFATEVKAYDDVAVRMPLRMAQDLMRTRGVDVWVVGLRDTAQTQDVARRLDRILAGSPLEQATWLQLSDFYRKSVALLSRQMTVVGILVMAILVLGIANLMTMRILERTGEIGTMLALGTSRHRIARMVLMEGVLVGTAGAIVGLAIGYLLAQVISAIGIPMPPPPGRDAGYRAQILLTGAIAAKAALIAIGSAAIAGLYPALRASRIAIVDALRSNR